jgi:hypothetical protein
MFKTEQRPSRHRQKYHSPSLGFSIASRSRTMTNIRPYTSTISGCIGAAPFTDPEKLIAPDESKAFHTGDNIGALAA